MMIDDEEIVDKITRNSSETELEHPSHHLYREVQTQALFTNFNLWPCLSLKNPKSLPRRCLLCCRVVEEREIGNDRTLIEIAISLLPRTFLDKNGSLQRSPRHGRRDWMTCLLFLFTVCARASVRASFCRL